MDGMDGVAEQTVPQPGSMSSIRPWPVHASQSPDDRLKGQALCSPPDYAFRL
jgi:hypothetical protein